MKQLSKESLYKEVLTLRHHVSNNDFISIDASLFHNLRFEALLEVPKNGDKSLFFDEFLTVSDYMLSLINYNLDLLYEDLDKAHERTYRATAEEQELFNRIIYEQELLLNQIDSHIIITLSEYYLLILLDEYLILKESCIDRRPSPAERLFLSHLKDRILNSLRYCQQKDENKDFIKQQFVFAVNIMYLMHFELISKVRVLNIKEAMQVDHMKLMIWNNIAGFGFDEYKRLFANFAKYSDSSNEVLCMLSEQVFALYKGYDPFVGTPTTYFAPHFREAIVKYMYEYILKLTHHDAYNLRIIKNAIAEFEYKNIEYDVIMIANHTGLSIEVVQNTLMIGQSLQIVDIDAYKNLISSDDPNPESVIIEKEFKSKLYERIHTLLDPVECFVFYARVGIDTIKERTYLQVAKMLSASPIAEGKTYTTTEIRQIYSMAVKKLGDDKDLYLHVFGRPQKKAEYSLYVEMQPAVTDIMEENLITSLSEE